MIIRGREEVQKMVICGKKKNKKKVKSWSYVMVEKNGRRKGDGETGSNLSTC